MSKKTVTTRIKGTVTVPTGTYGALMVKSEVDLAIEIPVAPIAALMFIGSHERLGQKELAQAIKLIIEAQEE